MFFLKVLVTSPVNINTKSVSIVSIINTSSRRHLRSQI